MFKWGLGTSSGCQCGDPNQTISHIVEECPLFSFGGGLGGLHNLEDGAVEWLIDLPLDLWPQKMCIIEKKMKSMYLLFKFYLL